MLRFVLIPRFRVAEGKIFTAVVVLLGDIAASIWSKYELLCILTFTMRL